MNIKITWRVDDGYAGGDRPHQSTVSATMFSAGQSDEEIADELASAIQEDFNQRICLDLRTEDVAKAVKEIRGALAKENSA